MSLRLSRRSLLWSGTQAAGLVWSGIGTARSALAPDALVFVRLRGGADGLSLLVPHTDELYYRARPSTAIRYASPTQAGELALDARFALHPQLAPLRPWFDAGELGAIVAVGLPDLVRSHQAARHELDDALARALAGSAPVCGPGLPSRAPRAWSEQLRAKTGPRALYLELDGWDVHAAQGDAAQGRQAEACRTLATELAALKTTLGTQLSRVLVVVVSEFGRSLAETSLQGSDDGHASTMLVLGGPRRWGRVLGTWPGLRPEQLSVGRHLLPTSDVGTVIGQLARGEEPA